MLVLCLLLVKIVLLEKVQSSTRIIGGIPAAIEDYPYTLQLLYETYPICGAALISPNVALTAAHCIMRQGTYSVRAGSARINQGGEVANVRRAELHPRFSHQTNDYDICILKLDRKFSYSNKIQAVKLPKEYQNLPVGAKGTVTGWGRISEYGESRPSILRAVDIPVLNMRTCMDSYNVLRITPRMFCAGYLQGGRDSCQGDSGGPFVVNGTLIGLVSWGLFCAMSGYPGVYTNIAQVRDFIGLNVQF